MSLNQPALIPWNRTLFVSSAGLEHAKRLVTAYKQGLIPSMTPELWQAKKVVDSTLHPGIAPKSALSNVCSVADS